MVQSSPEQLFPEPALPPSLLSPKRWPGTDQEAMETLQRCLVDNHQRWHIFFNDRGFHNHVSHHLLAIHAMGASGPVLEAAYKSHCVYQRSAYESPGPITDDNFFDHLADEDYYRAYLEYFTDMLLKKGLSKTFEDCIFSQKANFNSAAVGQGKQQPEMLNRFVEGVFHPFIHTGYGAEFGLIGLAAEGLAMTAVQPADSTVLLPRDLFKSSVASAAETLVSRLSNLALDVIPQSLRPASGLHVFTIMARILKDERFAHMHKHPEESMYTELLKAHGETIREYGEMWKIDTSDPKNVDDYIEQLVWMNVVIYGIGGWKEGEKLNADFFLMHLVTSVLFVPSLLAYLSPFSQSLLLRAYFVTSLGYWLVRGRPALPINQFFEKTSATLPTPPGPQPVPAEETLPTPTISDARKDKTANPLALTPNGWLPIIQTTLVHPNEHLCKLQRALAHFAAMYGARVPGHFAGTELDEMGGDRLDGTLFLRVAGLTADRLGWMREGQVKDEWDFMGFFE